MLIEWRPDFETGDPDIDHEHRTLIDIANDLQGAVWARASQAMVIGNFRHLIDYTRRHFANEEKAILAAGYENAARHIEIHRRFEAQVSELMTRFTENPNHMDPVELASRLSHKIVNHIVDDDMQFRAHLTNQGGRSAN